MKIGEIDTDNYNAANLYKQMATKREPFLQRAREAAELTLPRLFPPEGTDSNTQYANPYQSLGARGVNNLANKIILSLFPPATAFFKLSVPQEDLEAAGKGEGDMKEAVYGIETAVVDDMEKSSLRPKLVDGLKQGIIGGCFVLYIPDDDNPRVFSLETFGVKRDSLGNVQRLVIKETLSYSALSKEKQDLLKIQEEAILNGEKELDLYTVIIRESKDQFVVWQEINGLALDSTAGQYSEDDLPYKFIPLVEGGEDYGRAYVEDFIGDIKSLEGLRKALLESAAESAKIIYLVKPNSTLNLKKLQGANSGDCLVGNEGDVTLLQSNKRLDMEITQREAQELKMELSTAFLLDSAVRRNAERVTAEEIRKVSQELEVAFGGVYSTLANTLQRPIVKLYMKRQEKKGRINEAIKKGLDLEITTGAAALGRGTNYQTIMTFVETLKSVIPEDQLGSTLDIPELVKRVAYSLDINTGSLVKTSEQQALESDEAQTNEIVQNVAPAIAQEVIKE